MIWLKIVHIFTERHARILWISGLFSRNARLGFRLLQFPAEAMIQDVAFAGPGVRLTDRIGLGVLTRLIGRDVIDEVLAETGHTERRSRLLPVRVVVYYVLAPRLFFGEGYEEVMRRLVIAGAIGARRSRSSGKRTSRPWPRPPARTG
jgi:hypothetical protein